MPLCPHQRTHYPYLQFFSSHEQKLIILAIVLFPLLCSPMKTLTLFSSISTFLIGPIFLMISLAIYIILKIELQIYAFFLENHQEKPPRKPQEICKLSANYHEINFSAISLKQDDCHSYILFPPQKSKMSFLETSQQRR